MKALRHDFGRWAKEHQIEQTTLLEQEKVFLDRRRQVLGLAQHTPSVGLALSGGGIRSATFSLGLLRELASLRLLHRFDYLSTVSGGSYIGSYYAGLFALRQEATNPILNSSSFGLSPGTADAFDRSNAEARASLEWLRQSGRYLAPQGAGDYWKAVGLLARNWIGVHIVIGTALMLAALIGVASRIIVSGLPLNYVPKLFIYAPLLLAASIPISLHIVFAWAYWLTRRGIGKWQHGTNWAQFGTVAIALFALAVANDTQSASFFSPKTDGVCTAAWVIFAFASSALILLAIGMATKGAGVSKEEAWDHCRTWLTKPLGPCAFFLVAICAAAAADAFAFWIFSDTKSGTEFTIALSPTLAAILVPMGRWLVAQLMRIAGSAPRSHSVDARATLLNGDSAIKLGAAFAAVLLIVLVAIFWTVIAYEATWPLAVAPEPRDWYPLFRTWLIWFVVIGLLAGCIARTTTFINLSGLTSFYAGRLRRAYLGAGNPKRLNTAKSPGTVTLDKWDKDDDVTLGDYYGTSKAQPPEPSSAAPLHLINVTLNETRGTGTNIVQRDRRGRNLVLSPAGIYCNGDIGGTLYRINYEEEDHEALPLSTWVAISGAAFSTGLGNRSGFPMSLLAGLANVRLGYWWRTNNSWAGGYPTQYDLLREFRGDFPGPSEKFWYLSDGGHFENTGAYELIRRKLPFIVVSDNGMDERFEYEDIANLVRKARIDLDCEITFLNSEELDTLFSTQQHLRDSFGTLLQIAGKDNPLNPNAVAALARLRYETGDSAPPVVGTLLLIKPRLTGDGPIDLIRYKEMNTKFPQQTTLDQFFDEAQWESYYYLGRLIAQAIFGSPLSIAPSHTAATTGWNPASLTAVP